MILESKKKTYIPRCIYLSTELQNDTDHYTIERLRQAECASGRKVIGNSSSRNTATSDAPMHKQCRREDVHGTDRKILLMESRSVASVDFTLSRIDRRNLA